MSWEESKVEAIYYCPVIRGVLIGGERALCCRQKLTESEDFLRANTVYSIRMAVLCLFSSLFLGKLKVLISFY